LIPLASYNDVWGLEHRSLVTALEAQASPSEEDHGTALDDLLARKVSDENRLRKDDHK